MSKLPPSITANAAKVIKDKQLGVIQLNAPEAEWLMNVAGLTVGKMQAAEDAGNVMLKDKAIHAAQKHGLTILSQKARNALHELLPAYNAEPIEETIQ